MFCEPLLLIADGLSQSRRFNAVERSRAAAWTPGESNHVSSTPPWPSINLEQRAAILQEGAGLVDLWEASPIRIDENKPRTKEIIDVLFPGDPLLCCSANKGDFATRSGEDWRGELSYLVVHRD